MPEEGGSNERERGAEGRDRWHAMQSAYEEYRIASEALQLSQQSADESSTGERLRLIIAAQEQRAAFEGYVHARMAFLEYQFDEVHGPGACKMPLVHRARHSGILAWLRYSRLRPVLETVAVVLMCLTMFCLLREQKRVRELAASSDQLRATLRETREGLQAVRQKLDFAVLPHHAAVQQTAARPHAPGDGAAGGTPVAAEPNRRQPAHQRNLQQLAGKKRSPSQNQAQRAGARTSTSFFLVPSRQFKRIGPIEVSLRTIDPDGGVNLVMLSGRVRTDVKRLRQNQPVWIKVDSRQQRLGLVLDRISRNRVDGHLIETRVDRLEASAKLRPRTPAGP